MLLVFRGIQKPSVWYSVEAINFACIIVYRIFMLLQTSVSLFYMLFGWESVQLHTYSFRSKQESPSWLLQCTNIHCIIGVIISFSLSQIQKLSPSWLLEPHLSIQCIGLKGIKLTHSLHLNNINQKNESPFSCLVLVFYFSLFIFLVYLKCKCWIIYCIEQAQQQVRKCEKFLSKWDGCKFDAENAISLSLSWFGRVLQPFLSHSRARTSNLG